MESLRQKIIDAHNRWTACVAQNDKTALREMHVDVVSDSRKKVIKLFQKRSSYFINGRDINVNRITPEIVPVNSRDPLLTDLLHIVRSTWSIPVSAGFGRRLRFLIMDTHHQAVMGVLSLQSPPIDLACRDALFRYPAGEKTRLINRTMDAHLVGAIPPYSHLLGGKLVAGLLASDVVSNAYRKKYNDNLVAITTTSAYGRSSIYNRLKYRERLLATSIGYTKGFGTVHLESVYDEMMTYLKSKRPDFSLDGKNAGPKIRWQNISRVFHLLNLPNSTMRHGIKREVFLFPLSSELTSGMAGGDFGVSTAISASSFIAYWLERWCLPRAERFDDWQRFDVSELFNDKNT